MSSRISHELTYDAPLGDVATMLADPAFRKQVCDDQHVLRHEVSVSGSADTGDLDVTIDQVQAARGIPSFAKKFVGDEINIVQTERWSTPDRGEIAVAIPGKPGEISGTAVLVESDGTTTETVTYDIRVSIPLVGGKIEGVVGDLLLKALTFEERTGRAYLSR